MVFLQYLYYVLSISSRSLFLMMMMNLVFAGATAGLTLKLIHRDSPESPLYPGNLTQLERMERAFQQSIDREQQLTAAWMKSSSSSSWVSSRNNTTNSKSHHLDMARPRVFLAQKLYMVEIGIGTFPNLPSAPPGLNPIFYYLLIDTGSDLLWLQCKGSSDYFNQDAPLFDWQSSLTYQPLPAHSPHPICMEYGSSTAGGLCGYGVRYGDGSSTSGILATEKLTVNADDGLEVINNFVFGCGLRQIETTLGKNVQGKNPVAGILGLGGGMGSFIQQLGEDQSQNKFEYCLKPSYDDSASNTFLRFGSDTKIVEGGQGVQTTSTLPVRGDTIYYLTMAGISVGRTQVVYPDPRVFQTKFDGTGGCIIDSGCAVTQLSPQVYGPLKNHLIRFFESYHIKITRPQEPFELCFTKPNEQFNQFPTITFHYSGADFVIEPYAAFTVGNRKFCLNILRTRMIPSYSVILGSLQQVNHRILYDLGKRKISWATENCAALG